MRQDLSTYEGLQLQSFLDQWHRFHRTEPDEIVVGPSSRLRDRPWDRPVRFAHIDGGHTNDVVRDDIAVAHEVLAPTGGVVVFDDVRAANAPGVGAAIWGAVESDGLVPFAQSWKLYASWDADFAARAADAVSRSMPCRDHVVNGRRLVQVEPAPQAPPTFARRWTPPALVPAAAKLRDVLQAAAGRWKR